MRRFLTSYKKILRLHKIFKGVQMDLVLKDKVFIVTGGAQGIGLAIVKGALSEGARVCLLDRNTPCDIDLSQEQLVYLKCDLEKEQDIKSCVAFVIQKWGTINGLVNNAGINDAIGISDGLKAFEKSLQKNLLHYFGMLHHCLDYLKKSRGAVINISSKVSLTGQGGTSGYAASKGAINALTREWALDLAKDGIRVNCVVPSEVLTPMYTEWLEASGLGVSEKQKIASRIPFERRFTSCQEIADTTLFLLSERSSHTTGQIVFVDGGYVHLDRRFPG